MDEFRVMQELALRVAHAEALRGFFGKIDGSACVTEEVRLTQHVLLRESEIDAERQRGDELHESDLS